MSALVPFSGDLFAPPPKPEAFYSSDFRVWMVDGDGMEPALRSRWDYVLLAPVSEYVGEGIYLVAVCGGQALYRAQTTVGGQVLFKLDNPVYRDGGSVCSKEEFAEVALGFVVADIKVRDRRFLAGGA